MPGKNTEPTFAELLEQFPQLFQMPEDLADELSLHGEQPRWQGIGKIATRYRCCGPIIVKCEYAPPVLDVCQPTLRSLSRDISRSGISFINGLQYYPEQILKIYLPVAFARVRVARCRYLAEDLYETGVKTLEYVSRN